MSQLPLCSGHVLTVVDGLVLVEGAGDVAFFEKAEEIEDTKVGRALRWQRWCCLLQRSVAKSRAQLPLQCFIAAWM